MPSPEYQSMLLPIWRGNSDYINRLNESKIWC